MAPKLLIEIILFAGNYTSINESLGWIFFLLSCFIQMLDMVTCTSILQLPLGGTFANPGLLKSGASR